MKLAVKEQSLHINQWIDSGTRWG